MNYDNSQQYGFNFGVATAAAANQQPTPQNVSGTVYPYTFHGGEFQHLSTKVCPAPAGPTLATMAGKNILYDPQHQLQQQQQQQFQQQQLQQQQLQQQAAAFSMVQGTLVGRQGMFPVAAGLSVAQEPVCPPQTVVEVYGNLSPNMISQKVPSAVAVSAAGYKNFASWMTIPQAMNSNLTSSAINTSTVASTNNQSALPSFGHLWSHFQQQQQQKHQPAVTAFIQPSPQHQQPQHQQPGVANFQSVQVFQSPAAGLQVSAGGLQVSPGGLQMSPGSMQVSPGGQTFHISQSLQGTLSPNQLASAGISLSGLRQVQMSGAVGAGIRSQVLMAPRGQVIMAQTLPSGTAAFNFSSDMKSLQPVAKLSAAAHPTTNSTISATIQEATAANTSVSSITIGASGVTRREVMKDALPGGCIQVCLTTTTVTVTTAACSLNSTTATAVHVNIPVTTTISVLPSVSTSSCQHVHSASPLSCLMSDGDVKDESGRGSASPSTSSAAASLPTQESVSEESSRLELDAVKVPYSWHRVVENGTVHYYSPSHVRLSTFDDIRAYLSQSNTCKCGLECPLIVERIFSFDPALDSRPWSIEDVTCSQDLTKLCNHKRKVLALAAFQSSTASQELHGNSDGPAAKCRKREKSKLGDNLLVSPLVVDSKLKTSITNAVNKHAAASAHNLHSSSTGTAAADPSTGSGNGQTASTGQSMDGGATVHCTGQIGCVPLNCQMDHSGSIRYPPSSPRACSTPASMHSTPGVPIVSAADPMEGMSPMSSQFPNKIGQTVVGSPMRIGAVGLGNHMDLRSFSQSALQCSAFPQEDIKQSYFMQQLQQHQQPPHSTPASQFANCGMPTMTSPHLGPHYRAQTFRTISPLGMPSQYSMGFPQGQHQHQQHSYPQHNHPMVYQMNMALQQQPHHHPQQAPHAAQNVHHHKAPHPMFQNIRPGSQPLWSPQHLPSHNAGPAPPPGYHPDPHHLQGGGMFAGIYPQAGDLMWLETGKPKSKRPRSKKDKQKLNSIVDRTSPCEGPLKHKIGPPGTMSKSIMPFTSTFTTSTPHDLSATANTTTLPCSVSFLDNPGIFVAQQTAIINSSLASCQLDLHSPTQQPTSSVCSKLPCDSIKTMQAKDPAVKVELDLEAKVLNTEFTVKGTERLKCKKEPGTEMLQHEVDISHVTTQMQPRFSGSMNCNNNQLIVSKSDPDLAYINASVSPDADCSCGIASGSTALMHAKKKASPKSKSRSKSLTVASKTSSMASDCLPDCVQTTVPQQTHQQQQHQATGDTSVAGLAPFQVSGLSQMLATGSCTANWNLLSLQQALAHYASVSAGNNSGLSVSGGNGGGTVEFPASSLLTAAARAQLSQQASLNSFLLPAFLSAGGVAGQDISGVMQQQQQQQQQPDQLPAMTHNGAGGGDTGDKMTNAVVTGLVGVSSNNVASMNQGSSLPLQLVQGQGVVSSGMVPAGPFQNGGLLAQSVPLNVVVPVNQQFVGLGTDPVHSFPIDMAGSVVASISLGTAVCKTLHVSPKVVTSLVDSVANVSPGANVPTFSSMGSVSAAFSPQGCDSVKGAGSTIHHLPQNSAGHGLSIANNTGQTVSQYSSLSASHCAGQAANQSIGENVCANVSSGHNLGVNVSVGLGAGDTVVLNSLLPSILGFNTAMPPISLPMMTNVTNSLTQVIPAAGATPALLTQQQQATAQFLNALAIPTVAAAALSPMLIAHSGPVASTTAGNLFSKACEGIMEVKGCSVDSMENTFEDEQMDEEDDTTQCDLEDSVEPTVNDGMHMAEMFQSSQSHVIPMASTDHSQQVIVLPGGGLPLMHVLNGNTHSLGVVDKLCNATQVFLPTAPPAPLMPDLTVAALTPLSIQQMWNSLNSLQLQQLQTIQLQQLVWQQLQGMQALPHHLAAMDGGSQALLFGVQPQQHQVQPLHMLGHQQMPVSPRAPHANLADQGDGDRESMQNEASAGNMDTYMHHDNCWDKDGGEPSDKSTNNADVSGQMESESPMDWAASPDRKAKNRKEEKSRFRSVVSIKMSSLTTQEGVGSSVLDSALSHTTEACTTNRKPSQLKASTRDVKNSVSGEVEKNQSSQHTTLNGDCMASEQVFSRRRAGKRGLDDRCNSADLVKGLSGKGVACVPVMSGPTAKLQGPCST